MQCENESLNVNNFTNKIINVNEDNDENNELKQLMKSDTDLLRQWTLNIIPSMICLKYYTKKCLLELPKTTKTFLNTKSADYYIENISEVQETEGQFVYFGKIKYLQAMVKFTYTKYNRIIH